MKNRRSIPEVDTRTDELDIGGAIATFIPCSSKDKFDSNNILTERAKKNNKKIKLSIKLQSKDYTLAAFHSFRISRQVCEVLLFPVVRPYALTGSLRPTAGVLRGYGAARGPVLVSLPLRVSGYNLAKHLLCDTKLTR